MELLSEYDGAKSQTIKQDAVPYLNEQKKWAIDFYVNGTIVQTRTFPDLTEEKVASYANLFKEGVIHPNDWL